VSTITSQDEAVDRYSAIAEKLAEPLAVLQSEADVSALDVQQVRYLVATLAGVLQACAQLARDLELTQDLQLIVVPDGRRQIQIWNWRRATRAAVIRTADDARRLFDQVRELDAGRSDRLIYTIEGETLQRVAARELGGFAEWPRLIDANPGVQPGLLPTGTPLVIPPRPPR
jgi:hypothetical protein